MDYPAARLEQREFKVLEGTPGSHHSQGHPGPRHRHQQQIKSLSQSNRDQFVFPTFVATRRGLDIPATPLSHTRSPRISRGHS